jgi:hypothetical protein
MYDQLLGLPNYFCTAWFVGSTVLILLGLAIWAWYTFHNCSHNDPYPFSEEGCRHCDGCDYFQDGLCVCNCHQKGAKPTPNLTIPLRAISPGDISVGIQPFDEHLVVRLDSNILMPEQDWKELEALLCEDLSKFYDCAVVPERDAQQDEARQEEQFRKMEEENNA